MRLVLALVAAAFLAAGCTSPSEPVLLAGAERVDITPQRFPAPYNLGIEELAHGVNDPLYARILYLEDEDDRVLIVAMDWEGLLRSAHDRTIAAVSAATGVPPERIIVNASHTHNAPWTNLDTEALLAPAGIHLVDVEYFEESVGKVAAAAARAIEKKRPARVSAGSGQLPELQVNHRVGYVRPEDREALNAKRRYPVGVTDPTVGVARIEDEAGAPIATITHFAAHGTTSAGPGLISGDYPGAAMRRLEAELGEEVVALFLQGCGANLSPGDGLPQGSPAAVEHSGNLLAERVLSVLAGSLTPARSGGFGFAVREVVLPFVPLGRNGDLASLERTFETALATYVERKRRGEDAPYANLVALGDRLTLARNVDAWSRYEIHALSFGDALTLVFLPGETFVEFALEIRDRVGGDGLVLVAAYNDSTPVYIPTPTAFEVGGYEVGPWCYSTPETGRVMVEAALEMIRGLPR